MLLRPCLALLLSCASVLAQAPDPELLQRYSEAGQRALAEHRYVEAEQAYESALAADPGNAEAHFNLSRLCERLGQPQRALRHLQAYRGLIGAGQRLGRG